MNMSPSEDSPILRHPGQGTKGKTQPHGLLAAEDPDVLVKYVLEAGCPRVNRAAVLAHVRKEINYAL